MQGPRSNHSEKDPSAGQFHYLSTSPLIQWMLLVQGPQWKHLEEAGSEDLSHTATPPGSTYTADTNTVVDSAEFAVAMAKLSDDLKGANDLTHPRCHERHSGVQRQCSGDIPLTAPCGRRLEGSMQQASVCNKLPPSAINILFQILCASTSSCFCLPCSQALGWQPGSCKRLSWASCFCIFKCRRLKCRQGCPCAAVVALVSELVHIAAPVCSPLAAPLSLHSCAVTHWLAGRCACHG